MPVTFEQLHRFCSKPSENSLREHVDAKSASPVYRDDPSLKGKDEQLSKKNKISLKKLFLNLSLNDKWLTVLNRIGLPLR